MDKIEKRDYNLSRSKWNPGELESRKISYPVFMLSGLSASLIDF